MSGNYSYPLEETNGNARPTARRQDTHGSNESGGQKGVRRVSSDAYNVMSDSEGAKQRRQSLKAGNANATRKRSRNTLRERTKVEKQDEPVDDSAWIHRDKLAQIEIQEMEEAGIPLRPSRRSMSADPQASSRSSRSRSRSRRRMSKDRASDLYAEEQYSAAYGNYEEFERKRVSTIPAADEEEQSFDPTIDTEFRMPQELAAEQSSIRSNTIRPSTSRIPVSKISPVPVPPTVVGRDSPLPRSRNGSGAWSGNWDEMQYARRARSNSIGSQVILDEDGVHTPPRPGSSYMRSSDENSPPKSRLPNKSTPAGRKGSAGNGAQRPGSSSGGKPRTTSSNKERPTSRGGHKSRPSTSHQFTPEGEAPWIATMYKPDPRLPPDQQMLPTHAKRMMQERWEKDGQAGTAYDRDLRPINNEQLPPQPKSPTKPAELHLASPVLPKSTSPISANGSLSPNPRQKDSDSQWPLTPKSDTRSENGSVRPGTSGGYKITPTIASPPAIERSTNQLGFSAQPHNPTPRVPDYDDKEDAAPKRGGCACCVVM